MTDSQTNRSRPAHESSGSPQRPPHQVDLPLLSFDLTHECGQLRQEESYRAGDRNARTLVKEPGIRVVLTVMKGGTRLKEHKTDGALSVQTLAGHIRLHALGETIELPVGHVATLAAAVPHDVEAVDESAFLLTLVSP